MKTIDKLRQYLRDGLARGELHPGDKLPTYYSLIRQFDACYATIQNAMTRLAEEGLVEIVHGSGTFVAGGSPLRIVFIASQESILFSNFVKVLKKHLGQEEHHLEMEFIPVSKMMDSGGHDKDVVIQYGRSVDLELCDNSMQSVYEQLAGEYESSGICGRSFFPCHYVSYQMGVNGRLLKQLHHTKKYFMPDFSWWEEFCGKCREAGIVPASLNCPRSGKSHIECFYGYLLSQFGGDDSIFRDDRQMFDTPVGEKMLRMLKDMNIYEYTSQKEIYGRFYSNDAVMDLMVGNWIYSQNRDSNRPDICIDDLQVIPYRSGKKRVLPLERYGLSVKLPAEADASVKSRVEQLLRLLLSREFQRDWCNVNGMISLRRDLAPRDYDWNDNQHTQSFFKTSEDLTFNMATLISPSTCACLSTILDFYNDYRISPGQVLKMMDIKKNERRADDHYLSGTLKINL